MELNQKKLFPNKQEDSTIMAKIIARNISAI